MRLADGSKVRETMVNEKVSHRGRQKGDNGMLLDQWRRSGQWGVAKSAGRCHPHAQNGGSD